MFWLRGCNLRTLKSMMYDYQDGVLYTWKSWATPEMIGLSRDILS